MNLWFLYIICCSTLAFVLVSMNRYFREIAHWLKRKLPWTKGKPFSCYFCTGTWLCFGCFYHASSSWLELILVSLTSGCFAMLYEFSYLKSTMRR